MLKWDALYENVAQLGFVEILVSFRQSSFDQVGLWPGLVLVRFRSFCGLVRF